MSCVGCASSDSGSVAVNTPRLPGFLNPALDFHRFDLVETTFTVNISTLQQLTKLDSSRYCVFIANDASITMSTNQAGAIANQGWRVAASSQQFFSQASFPVLVQSALFAFALAAAHITVIEVFLRRELSNTIDVSAAPPLIGSTPHVEPVGDELLICYPRFRL